MTRLHQTTVHTAKVIAEMFAPQVETVVYDLTHPLRIITHVFPGTLTGQKKGDSPTILSHFEATNFPPYLLNYEFTGPNNLKMKASTIFYKNELNCTQVALSIYFNTDYFK